MSVHQVAKYVGAPLEQPAADSGRNLLGYNSSTIRSIIGGKRRRSRKARKARKSRKQRKQSGGFLPSIGEPFVAAVSKYIAPLALFGVYKFMNGSKKTRKRSSKR